MAILLARFREPHPGSSQNHLLGRSREVGGAGSMAHALVMLVRILRYGRSYGQRARVVTEVF